MMTNATNPAAPALTGQVIGQTQHAIQAVLDSVLLETGTTFHQWVLIRQVALNGSTVPRADLVAAMIDGLKIEPAAASVVLGEVIALDLATAADDTVVLTAAGRARYERIATAAAEITVRLYGGLPPEDLETTRRVLTTVRDRANAELARAGAVTAGPA